MAGGWTVRVRLTVLYGGLFLLAGAVLLGVTYLLLAAALEKQQLKPAVVYAEGAGMEADAPVSTGGVAISKTDMAAQQSAIDLKMSFARQVQLDLNAQTLQSLLRWGSLALGGVAVAGVWTGWLAAGRTLRPIAQITATARRVADRNLHERIALGGPRDELRELADTFDDMLERLDRSFDGQRRFVANASHELRTPLAINRTLLEVAMGQPDAPQQLRQLGTTLLEVNARHERLIDGLLTMARSEQAVVDPVPVDLAEVAGNVLDQTQAPGVDVRHELRPAPTSGDPVLLERLTQNLVDNAVRYNSAGGWVHVTCAHEGTRTRLNVVNTGPVVRAYEVPTLFEPFRRLTDRVGSARGTGLGLSIVRSVARAHGGEVHASPRDGGGLVVQVTLPAN
ncbi:sensor histidine kinase [Phytohabitans suffuscus]|uniref:histidine kinase n=1 Tax=Phytohabitans suffuscus TaxID=624315 RepID=A0A6F8YIG7_9ACTN|nr:HAMP domain-containing sensor histidine kinase [Phytohabitans suffuscus]BCB85758.1 sensor protein CutS [Phytohabitans suffuscus]